MLVVAVTPVRLPAPIEIPFQPAVLACCQSHQRDARGAVRARQLTEPDELTQRRILVDLPERIDRALIDGVVRVSVGVHRVDARTDVDPVHLWHVVLSAAGSEEHRVGKPGVVIHVGESSECDREALSDVSPRSCVM